MTWCPVTWLQRQPRCRSGLTGPGAALAGYMKMQILQSVTVTRVSFLTPATQAQWPWVKGCVML